jgi:hypothetical protein
LGKQLAEEAIALDPDYAAAHMTLAWAHAMDARVGWSDSPKQSLARAQELVQKAVALDDALPQACRLWGLIYLIKR